MPHTSYQPDVRSFCFEDDWQRAVLDIAQEAAPCRSTYLDCFFRSDRYSAQLRHCLVASVAGPDMYASARVMRIPLLESYPAHLTIVGFSDDSSELCNGSVMSKQVKII